jgi:4-oxalocrotonate tautomerase
MPVIIINMLSGRSREKKRKLIRSVTDAVVDALGVQRESVRVIINEIPHEHYGIAGLPVDEHRKKQKSNKTKVEG